MDELAAELARMREQARLGGGLEAIKKHHQAGKLTAHERLERLLDPHTFVELDPFMTHRFTEFDMDKRRALGDGVVTGFGKIDGRDVAVYAQDGTFLGGSLGEAHLQKISQTVDLAMKMGIPLVGLNDSGGARIQEGVTSLHTLGELFVRNVLASGVVPQIIAIMGPCAGGAVYSPALGDFVIMVEQTSYMFITGPRVVQTVTHEEISSEALGGARAQSEVSGVAHFSAKDEAECFTLIKHLLSYLPANSLEDPPVVPTTDNPERVDEELNRLVPADPRATYNMHSVIERVFDYGSFLEVQKLFATNVIIGFARLMGQPVGVVANQPQSLAGTLDIDSSDKIARFVRFCDCFNIPLVTFVDVPGYLPGVRQEHGGVIRHGAKVIYAYSEATVPKITIVVRKAYGGAYIAMCSKSLGADIVYAYPTAEIAVMGAEGAVEIMFRRELEQAPPEKQAELAAKMTEEYRSKFANPYVAAARGYVNAVIEPKDTRPNLVKVLSMLNKGKRVLRPDVPKKHDNMPV